jgi:hypothetical protein
MLSIQYHPFGCQNGQHTGQHNGLRIRISHWCLAVHFAVVQAQYSTGAVRPENLDLGAGNQPGGAAEIDVPRPRRCLWFYRELRFGFSNACSVENRKMELCSSINPR